MSSGYWGLFSLQKNGRNVKLTTLFYRILNVRLVEQNVRFEVFDGGDYE
jgi:hypothetical protein